MYLNKFKITAQGGEPFGLRRLLSARDTRVAYERSLLKDYPRQVLLVLTVVLPGPVKRDKRSKVIAEAAEAAIENAFSSSITYRERRDRLTGFEAYYIIRSSQKEAKRVAVSIEETHPLGRLFDLDIITTNGIPISRTDLGLPARSCLLCGEEARICMRAHRHSPEELQNKITELVHAFSRDRE